MGKRVEPDLHDILNDPFHKKGIIVGSNDKAKSSNWMRAENRVAISMVLAYVFIGILFYSLSESWTIIDCIYYCMVITTTVGYGDLSPSHGYGKFFTIYFALVGIGGIGMALGKVADLFLSRQKALAAEASKDLLKNVGNAAVQAASDKKNMDKSISEEKSETIKTRRQFRFAYQLLLATGPFLASVCFGLIVGFIEGWGILDSAYYSIITVTTIGFGDLYPRSQYGRLFAIFYLPIAVIAVANSIGNINELIVKNKEVKQEISMQELIEMDSDGDKVVSKMEYLCYMLIKLEKVDQDDLDEIQNHFDRLDVDKSGQLDKKDLQRFEDRLARRS